MHNTTRHTRKITISHTNPTVPLETKENDPTPTAEQTSMSETSKAKKEMARKSTRRALFTGDEDAGTPSGLKKSKKQD